MLWFLCLGHEVEQFGRPLEKESLYVNAKNIHRSICIQNIFIDKSASSEKISELIVDNISIQMDTIFKWTCFKWNEWMYKWINENEFKWIQMKWISNENDWII